MFSGYCFFLIRGDKLKKAICMLVAMSFVLSGCANLAALAGLAATGFGIYSAVKNSK